VKAYHIWQTYPKKSFNKNKPANILITGGVQGIGKLLAVKFAQMHSKGEINIIVIDIADHL
jgi:NAD(P)-dependent dehydrogenase (short-subunit alcohol dehydrogenase family)